MKAVCRVSQVLADQVKSTDDQRIVNAALVETMQKLQESLCDQTKLLSDLLRRDT